MTACKEKVHIHRNERKSLQRKKTEYKFATVDLLKGVSASLFIVNRHSSNNLCKFDDALDLIHFPVGNVNAGKGNASRTCKLDLVTLNICLYLFIMQHPLARIMYSCAHQKKKRVIEES